MRARLPLNALRVLGGAVLLALVAPHALSPDTFLSRRDIARLYLPLREYVAHELAAGRLPTWNHLDGLGTSLIGTAVAAPLHPMQLLLFALPPEVALKWQVLLCLVAAGLGAALLARRLGGAEPTWWLAGLAYAGSGYLVSITDNFPYLHGAALLPWVLWAAERLGERPTPRRALALGALLALGLHGGDVQGTLLACGLAGAWALLLAPARVRALGFLALAALVTLLLAAPLLPAIAATAVDTGRATGLRPEEVYLWSLSPLRLLELALGPLAPPEALDFHGVLLGRPLGAQTGALWTVSELVGAVVLALAPLGLLRSEAPTARRYAVLALLGVVLALGRAGGLYPLLLQAVPGWGAFRYPEKLMPFAVLGLSVLAARGLARPVGRATLVAAALLALLVAPFAVVLDADCVTAAFTALGTGAEPLPPALAEELANSLRAGASVALLGCIAVALAAWRWPRHVGWVAVAALALQVGWCARGVIATRPRAELAVTPQLLPAVQQAGVAQTRLAAWPERYSFHGKRLGAVDAVSLGDFEALAPDHNLRFGVGNLSPYAPGSMGELERACGLRPVCTSSCARRLGAQLCIVSPELVKPAQDRGAEVLAKADQPLLTLLRDARARALASVPGARPLPSSASLRDAFMEEEEGLPALVPGLERTYAAVPGAVTSRERPRPDVLEVSLTLPEENVLVVVEHCARGWTAAIDGGAPSSPLRADGGLCAVKVPAGTHRVTLRYVPPGWPAAWLAFGLGVLLGGALLGFSAASRRGTASAT